MNDLTNISTAPGMMGWEWRRRRALREACPYPIVEGLAAILGLGIVLTRNRGELYDGRSG